MAGRKFLTDFSIAGDSIDQVAGSQATSGPPVPPPPHVNGVSDDSAAQRDDEPTRASATASDPALSNESAGLPAVAGSTGDESVPKTVEAPPPTPPSSEPPVAAPPATPKFTTKREGGRQIVQIDEVAYTLVGLKEYFATSLRINLRVEADGRRHIDNADLYSARSRGSYARAAAAVTGLTPERIERDLVLILDHLEAARDRKLAEGEPVATELTAAEREAGMRLLTDPDIFSRIPNDLTALGYVGEEINKLLVYLAAVSRKTEHPLSVLVVSEAAAGKSYLIDTVARLVPPDELVTVTSLSDQALNYLPEDALVHRFLTLGEAVHSHAVEHQIREMLSAGKLSRLVTLKDPHTGELVSRNVTRRAKVAVALSTTNVDPNPENASRFFIVHADESPEQTKRIHAAQRGRYGLAAQSSGSLAEEVIRTHRAAGRLLEPVAIVNPYANALRFPSGPTRARRDHARFLDLIAAAAFLRQHQKTVHTARLADGRSVRYIECDLDDYTVSWQIMRHVLAQTVMSLPRGVVVVYQTVRACCRGRAEAEGIGVLEAGVTQREVREAGSMNHSAVKRALRRLVDYEYLSVTGSLERGHRRSYRLVRDQRLDLVDEQDLPTPEEVAAYLQNYRSGRGGSEVGHQWVTGQVEN